MTSARTSPITPLFADGGCVVKLSGQVDQSFAAAELVAVARGYVILDLDGVSRITSFGVREWMTALKRLPDGYAFTRVRPAMVAQFNMVANFGGAGQILSFYCPYLCAACGAETEILVDARREHALILSGDLTSAPCAACGGVMEMDDAPDIYLSHVRTCGRPSLPAAAEPLLELLRDAATDHFRVRKEVRSDVTLLWLSGPLDDKARLKRLFDGLEGPIALILSGVTSFTPDGVARLAPLFNIAGAQVFLARVRPELFQALTGQASAAKLVSLLLDGPCPGCRTPLNLELDAEAMVGADAPQREGGRCSCGRGGADLVPQPVWKTALEMIIEAPQGLKRYLDEGAVSGPALAASPPADTNRYQVVKVIATGGMAEVSIAYQRGTEGFEKKVVLKRILPHLSNDPAFVQMFFQEAKIAACISHPNVVQIYDLGREDGRHFIAMEYVRGWDLRALMAAASRQGKLFPVELACRIASDLSAGLHATHTCTDDVGKALGIIHRDVSPHNVLVSTAGAVKLADFGIAKVADSLVRTKPGTVKGKIIYMAPEQIEDSGTIDQRADIFPVGVILFECLTGVHPFRRETEIQSIHAVLNASAPNVLAHRPDLSPEVANVVHRAMARAPEERFPTAQSLQLALDELIAGAGKPASASHLAQWISALIDESDEADVSDLILTPSAGREFDMDADNTVRLSKLPMPAPTSDPGHTGSRSRREPR